MNSADPSSCAARPGAPLTLMLSGLLAIGCALPLAGIDVNGLGSLLGTGPEVVSQVAGSPLRNVFAGSVGALGLVWTAAGSAWMGRVAFLTGRKHR